MSTAIKRKLDLIAKHVNELSAAICREYGPDAYIYFEAEGHVHAMRDGGQESAWDTASERQERIIASSRSCNFDCGAW